MLLIFLVLPQGVFANVSTTEANAAILQTQVAGSGVVAATQNYSTTVNSLPVSKVPIALGVVTPCQYNSFNSGFNLQESGALNLNQSPNCFNSSILPNSKTGTLTLSVSSGQSFHTNVIVLRTERLVNPAIYPGAPEQQSPALPVIPLQQAMLLGLLFFGFLILQNKSWYKGVIVKSISIHKLKVLRC